MEVVLNTSQQPFGFCGQHLQINKMLGLIWNWGKKVVITGAVVSAAPFVIPPLFLISSLGFMVSVPFGFAFMGYACTAKVLKVLSIKRHLFLAGEDDGHLKSMIQRFEGGNDKKGQLEGLPEETERETKKKDSSEEDPESLDDKLCQSVKWKAKIIEEEAQQVADDRVVEKGKSKAFGERGTKQSETDEDWKEEEMEMETKREDRIKKEDVEPVDEKIFQSTKWGDGAKKETNQVADERVIEEGRGELFEVPKESKAVEGRKEEDKEPTKTGEKNFNHEVDVHVSEETLPGGHPSTQRSEPASSPGTEGYFAPPTLSFEDLTDATKAAASSEYSSLVVEAPLESNGLSTKCVDEGVFDEGKIWEEIESLRMIIGCKTALRTSFLVELKALYIFTGIEPPSAFSPDLGDVNHKLRYLKSVVGIKKP
ncbi:uncharacterized protein LOC116247171 isoform X2 [Nymphaea colorata]|uniref:uncharacterized protein LOC116247171 isoform X2 n=1 Tax=Nymphaea colorata TaxID=210225 RepID=UPI00129ECE8A|nr:uncharacterized protein LOC116247171 isoform X2 [Nymphaea colorata]